MTSQPGTSIRPTPDCGGPRKPPGAIELWWCDTHGEFHGNENLAGALVEVDRMGYTVYGARIDPPETQLEQARGIARELLENIRTGAAYPDALMARICSDPALDWLREP